MSKSKDTRVLHTVGSKIERTTSEEIQLHSRGYTIVKQLGEGSYAKVFHAEYTKSTNTETSKEELACKVIDTRKAPKEFVEKFLPRELNILLKIRHPHIIHVHSIIQHRTKYYVFMRYAEMGDLLEYVTNRGVVSEPQARIWFRQMAVAMQYLHEMDVAHRDLKCENALITKNLNIKIADFGFARPVTDSKGKPVTSETYCGSLSYAAPEVLRGTPYHPKSADIWSLGVILYVILNKAMPFDDNHARRLYDLQVTRRWKFRSRVADLLSENVKKLLQSLLEPDVNKRLKIEQILANEWIAMDPRLLRMTKEETQAQRSIVPTKGKDFKSLQKLADQAVIASVRVLKEASTNVNRVSNPVKLTNDPADEVLDDDLLVNSKVAKMENMNIY